MKKHILVLMTLASLNLLADGSHVPIDSGRSVLEETDGSDLDTLPFEGKKRAGPPFFVGQQQARAFVPSTGLECHREFMGAVETCGHRANGTWAGDGPCVGVNAAHRDLAGGLIATIAGLSTNNGGAMLGGARALANALPTLFGDAPRCRACLVGAEQGFSRCLNRVFPPGREGTVCGRSAGGSSRGADNSNYFTPITVIVTSPCRSGLRCCLGTFFHNTGYCYRQSETSGRTCE